MLINWKCTWLKYLQKKIDITLTDRWNFNRFHDREIDLLPKLKNKTIIKKKNIFIFLYTSFLYFR